jgi:hypothetical protein
MKFSLPWFKKSSTPEPPPAVHIFTPYDTPAPSIIKTGKWIWHTPTASPGILTGVDQYLSVVIMLVNELGENFREARCGLADVRIAKLSEIPLARRPTPEDGAFLGYF